MLNVPEKDIERLQVVDKAETLCTGIRVTETAVQKATPTVVASLAVGGKGL